RERGEGRHGEGRGENFFVFLSPRPRVPASLFTASERQSVFLPIPNTNSKFKIAFGKASPTKFKIGKVRFH
ncbi:MAG TPA: hypothetical protein VK203_28320, partial [Nostocaceae cyanobacterium]|nr:hypothetical protein [Nostocaceae cyanobacterium]